MKNMRAACPALFAITLMLLTAVGAYAQRTRSNPAPLTVAPPQPLFSEYKGIRLGMTTEEVRAKLGDPTFRGDDQDYYQISETESAQFVYDKTHMVVTISIDYTGAGAPDYRKVVGASIEQRDNGALYKMVRYEAQRFWVSYSRTGGASPFVTITIQKM